MQNKHQITIASRESKLALWQTHYIQQNLETAHPNLACNILTMKTKGDIIVDRPLSKIGGKALFMKELEVGMQAGDADIAVHSLKDVPYDLLEGFGLGAFCTRDNPADALVSNHYKSLDDLPEGAVIGTSSLRRKSQLLAYRPDFFVKDLRGLVQTRLSKLDEGQYDAIILAAAGLIRLGLEERISQLIPYDICLPAVGQGVVVVEYLEKNVEIKSIIDVINNPISQACSAAERSFNQALKGGCHMPIAAFCEIQQNEIFCLKAMVASEDGQKILRYEMTGKHPETLGTALAEKMIALGAREILSFSK